MFSITLSKNFSQKLFSGFVAAVLFVAGAALPFPNASVAGSPDEAGILLLFDRAPGPEEHALVQDFGGQVKYTFHLIPGLAVANVPSTACPGLSRNPHVLICTSDGEVQAIDAELDNTWGVKRIGAGTVHGGGNKGTGVKVAVIDSGIDYTHSDLGANFAGGYDFVNGDTDPMDDNGHGTHVAGTVAALKNSEGVVGAGPEASLYALKVLSSSGSGSWSDVIAALDWAAQNAIQVTNNSYGSGSNPGGVVEAAFDAAADAAGMVNVAAAGNSGNCGGKGNNVGYPARFASVIAVAATNQSDTRPCFSSTGLDVELAAPGVKINSTKLGGGYVEFNGTSMASPHVAGTAALVLKAGISDANGNGKVNDEVRDSMNATAEDLGNAGRDSLYGFGLISASAAVAAVGPPSPAVNVAASTDKTSYVVGEDTSAVVTSVVTNENNDSVSGLSSSAFSTTLNGAAVAVTFSETATPGTYAGALDISSLIAGTYTLEVTVTDTQGVSGSGSASFSVVDPAVNMALSTDKTDYVSGQDTTAVLTAVVADETGNAISGLDSSAFAATLNGSPVSVTFTEDLTVGTYTGNLDISGLADGSYAAEVVVTDARGISGSDSAGFTIGPAPSEPTTASVNSITYATTGGKNNDKHLNSTVTAVDDFGNPVSGASVSITLNHDSGKSWSGTGTTGTNGTVTFSLNNAPAGCYTTSVTDVTADGLSWDGTTPENGFCK